MQNMRILCVGDKNELMARAMKMVELCEMRLWMTSAVVYRCRCRRTNRSIETMLVDLSSIYVNHLTTAAAAAMLIAWHHHHHHHALMRLICRCYDRRRRSLWFDVLLLLLLVGCRLQVTCARWWIIIPAVCDTWWLYLCDTWERSFCRASEHRHVTSRYLHGPASLTRTWKYVQTNSI